MKRLILFILLVGLCLGGASLLIRLVLAHDALVSGNLELGEYSEEDCKTEDVGSQEIERSQSNVQRRLMLRIKTARELLAGKSDIPLAFEIFARLNEEACSPQYPPDEFGRILWIEDQINNFMEEENEKAEMKKVRLAIRNQMAWMLAEVH